MTDTWRLIDTGTFTASLNMALDETIATAVRRGNSHPTLRLYGWDRPSVSIGYFQKVSDIDSDYCIKKDIPIVRRPTGGRAILHADEITYSFSAKTDSGVFSKGLLDSYEKICKAFGLALLKIGVIPELKLQRESHRNRSPLCFQTASYGEITINNKKVIGSAQRRWTDCLLQQGSMPLTFNGDEIVKVFRLKSPETREQFTGFKNILPDLNIDSLKNVLRVSFEEVFNIRFIPSFPSREEISLAQDLEVEKYLSPSWNFRR